MVSLATAFLTLTGERRADAYVSVSILIYFVYTSIDPEMRLKFKLKTLDIAYFLVFSAIVTVRILSILGVL